MDLAIFAAIGDSLVQLFYLFLVGVVQVINLPYIFPHGNI